MPIRLGRAFAAFLTAEREEKPPKFQNEVTPPMTSVRARGLVLLVFLSPCFGQPAKLAADFVGLNPSSLVDAVVQFSGPVDEAQQGRLRALGVSRKLDLNIVNAAVYTLPAAALEALSKCPFVAYVSPDRQVSATLDYANVAVGAASARQYGWDGTGVGVAIIDSGIQPEADLLDKSTNASNVSRIVYSQSFVPGVSSTADDYGHGTHVAGIVAGNGTASTGNGSFKTFLGIAPKANLINLRVLDSKGMGTDSSVINAIATAIQLKNKYNIRLINLS